jgi:hypothetical protein
MSKKTSTAALESICKRQLTTRRRAPRHPAGGRRGRSNEVKRQGSNERAGEFGQAQIVVRQEGAVNRNKLSGAAGKLKVILPVILRITFCLVMWTLGAMTMTIAEAQTEEHRAVPEIPLGSARVENSRRRVDANHDTYYRVRSEKINRGFLD